VNSIFTGWPWLLSGGACPGRDVFSSFACLARRGKASLH
jgi:hypothetical protein